MINFFNMFEVMKNKIKNYSNNDDKSYQN